MVDLQVVVATSYAAKPWPQGVEFPIRRHELAQLHYTENAELETSLTPRSKAFAQCFQYLCRPGGDEFLSRPFGFLDKIF